MSEISVPSPLEIFREIQNVEGDLVQTEHPSYAGPLLYKRYNLIYLLVIIDRQTKIQQPEIRALLDSEGFVPQIVEELNGISESQKISTAKMGDLGFARGGILERFASELSQD